MRDMGCFSYIVREFLKTGPYLGLETVSLQKISKMFWHFGPRKHKILGRLVAPQIQQAAGADLVGRIFVASDVPDISGAGSLLRLFESGGRSWHRVALIIETRLPRAVSDQQGRSRMGESRVEL